MTVRESHVDCDAEMTANVSDVGNLPDRLVNPLDYRELSFALPRPAELHDQPQALGTVQDIGHMPRLQYSTYPLVQEIANSYRLQSATFSCQEY